MRLRRVKLPTGSLLPIPCPTSRRVSDQRPVSSTDSRRRTGSAQGSVKLVRHCHPGGGAGSGSTGPPRHDHSSTIRRSGTATAEEHGRGSIPRWREVQLAQLKTIGSNTTKRRRSRPAFRTLTGGGSGNRPHEREPRRRQRPRLDVDGEAIQREPFTSRPIPRDHQHQQAESDQQQHSPTLPGGHPGTSP